VRARDRPVARVGARDHSRGTQFRWSGSMTSFALHRRSAHAPRAPCDLVGDGQVSDGSTPEVIEGSRYAPFIFGPDRNHRQAARGGRQALGRRRAFSSSCARTRRPHSGLHRGIAAHGKPGKERLPASPQAPPSPASTFSRHGRDGVAVRPTVTHAGSRTRHECPKSTARTYARTWRFARGVHSCPVRPLARVAAESIRAHLGTGCPTADK